MRTRIRAIRLKELTRLVFFKKSHGVSTPIKFDEAILEIALPCLCCLRSAPQKNGAPGRGDIVAFIKAWCQTLYEERGAAWARGLAREMSERRAPYFHSADRAARVLGLTSSVRDELKIKTIGATDMGVEERLERRRASKAQAKAAKRKAAGATPRSESLAQTKPWAAEGVSRRTWYRRKAQVDTNSASKIVQAEPVPDTNSDPIGNVVTFKLPTEPKPCQRLEAGASVALLFGGVPVEPSQGARREDGGSVALLFGGGA